MKKECSLLGAILVAVMLFLLPGTMLLAANWNPLPDTGQETCYDAAGDELDPCPIKGEAFYGQDAQYDGPKPSYTNQTINGDVIVIDNISKLIWQQDTADTNNDGSITFFYYPTGDRMTWQDTIDYCGVLNFGGSSDWRLPTKFELQSIVDYGRYNPAINPAFSCESRSYWSATIAVVSFNTSAWLVDFSHGGCENTGSIDFDHFYIRCVRGGL